jgi:predicted transport protein
MADLKLFRTSDGQATELVPISVQLERDVQHLIDSNLDRLLGIRHVQSQYPTGKKHRGRIDTLGLDENGCPVIIEYKLRQNENIISQGLFYLDWLLDHRAEFQQIASASLVEGEEIDWETPRVLCIAEAFSRYDVYAVEQISRNIELIRYKRYEGFLILEAVNAPWGTPAVEPGRPQGGNRTSHPLTDDLEGRILSLGDDIQRKELKRYVAFRRLKNFVCVVPHKSYLALYLRLDPTTIGLEAGFSKDVREVGHWGTGSVEVRIESKEAIDKAMPLIQQSYERS